MIKIWQIDFQPSSCYKCPIMESGNIVEYIDRQKILCAVILEVKKQRFRLLSETNREVNLSKNRLLHVSTTQIDLSIGRDRLIDRLKETAHIRNSLINQINISELWIILNTEQEWIDLPTMTSFCFNGNPSSDYESAVIRAFFTDRLYFKFDQNRFFPHSEEQVELKIEQVKEAERRYGLITKSTDFLKKILAEKTDAKILSETIKKNNPELITILKSYCLYKKESEYYSLAKEILKPAGINDPDTIFDILVKLDIFDENENISLHIQDIPTSFSSKPMEHATSLTKSSVDFSANKSYEDLRSLPIITIDGQFTQDFDDALSIEDMGDHYRLGVHIADVGYYIKKNDIIDQEARLRGTSIYMPDQTIPMLPPQLAESLCSLQADEDRPAVSTIINIDRSFNIIDYDITCSIIKIKNRLTYYDVNLIINEDDNIKILHQIAKKFHQRRIDQGSVNITLPNINIWIGTNEEINLSTLNRESPARLLVAEIMIMANWLMADYLSKKKISAIFRSQPQPKERVFKGDDGTLFQNYRQRRLLSRFVLNTTPANHSGLGLDKYTTATSPIRKYYDLVTQRQIKAAIGVEDPYTPEEIGEIITLLKQPMSQASLIQRERNRYWLLKYLEKKRGKQEDAIIVGKRNDEYQILIPEYMIECYISASSLNNMLKPQDLIKVTIQNVNARKNIFSVYPC